MGRSPLLTACGTNELQNCQMRLGAVSEGEDLPIHEHCYNEKLNEIDIIRF